MHRIETRRLLFPLIIVVTMLFIGGTVGTFLSFRPGSPVAAANNSNFVVRVYYDDISDLTQLQSFDVWEYNNLKEHYVLVSVDLAGYQTLVDQGWSVAVDNAAGDHFSHRGRRFADLYGGYRTVDELYADLEAINSAAPNLSEVVDYGRSHCLTRGGCTTPGGDFLPGYPLRAFRITNEDVPGSSVINGAGITPGQKPVFFLMANIHAREITTPEIAMRFVDELIAGYGIDADITWLVDYHEIWVIPTTNPDGHWLVELGETPTYGGLPFYQRKNANNDSDIDGSADCPVWPPTSFEQSGIDLNRNHSFGWGSPGSSDQPCNMTFRGLSAASEVEVAALESLVRELIPDQRGSGLNDPAPHDTTGLLITLHSFSNLVLWPWGNSETPAPNKIDLKAIGDKFATYNGYLSCQPSLCLYLTSGSSDDWAYGELGIPAYTFEIGDQFMPPYAEIDDKQWPDNAPALFYAAKIARTPYITVHGPDILNLTVTAQGSIRTVVATVNDEMNGENPVTSVVYTIDSPPWQDGVDLNSLSPVDGALDTPVETVTGTIATDGLSPGRHTLFVQGRDEAGNWGAVSAVFFVVETVIPSDFTFLPYVLNR